jgi:hypothetical protein
MQANPATAKTISKMPRAFPLIWFVRLTASIPRLAMATNVLHNAPIANSVAAGLRACRVCQEDGSTTGTKALWHLDPRDKFDYTA